MADSTFMAANDQKCTIFGQKITFSFAGQGVASNQQAFGRRRSWL
jgi:hypothetical protein